MVLVQSSPYLIVLTLTAGLAVFTWAITVGRFTIPGGTTLGMAVLMGGSGVSLILQDFTVPGLTGWPLLTAGAVSLIGCALILVAVFGRIVPVARRLLYVGVAPGALVAVAWPAVWSFGPILGLVAGGFFVSLAIANPRLRMLPMGER